MPALDRGGLTLADGTTFCVGDASGDLLTDRPHGLFVRGLRVVSRWTLRVDGRAGDPVHAGTEDPASGTVLLRVPPDGVGGPALLLVRRRRVDEGMHEEFSLRNGTAHARRCTVTLAVGVDLADRSAVKAGHDRPAEEATAVDGPGHLLVRGHRHGHEHRVEVWGHGGALARPGVLEWHAEVPARGRWDAAVTVHVVVGDRRLLATRPSGAPARRPARPVRSTVATPRIETADRDLASALARGMADLAALRIVDPAHPGRTLLAAGVPWSMTLVGRDALLTAHMLLPVDPEVALGTLRTLADHQGRRTDPGTEEQPGRIPHGIRFASSGPVAPVAGDTDYGTADATALFVVVLGELARWTGMTTEIEALVPHADRALAWTGDDGDPDGDGLVEHRAASPEGGRHGGWRDSDGAVCFADGRPAEPPIALAEVQAYGYAAHRARATLADALGETGVARDQRERARALRRRFNERFWLPRRGCFALALDGTKRPVDAMASTMGHALWTGVVDEEHARAVADHLLSPAMFSGWGIRTLASTMGGYDPTSCHNGSVWPHDTALCVAGLVRYGFVAEGRRLARALLDAATVLDHGLPELFCGFDRSEFGVPVPHPTSCRPQAWAAAAPVALVRALLRLDPDVPAGAVRCGPVLPAEHLPFAVRGVRIGDHRVDLAVEAGGWSVAGLLDDGLRVVPVD
ncbi:glycogen debranching N-terminal domain-containing protein [Actinomycetospora chiangmaiensis]|uniref:amylo-alpha-1,6-glucosidase n=1 Tax=Actinomycetospora chiangmaiensis TaxID=402650 RepID=UPI00037C8FC1|nr:glycogen debranching N-terminal domain-containing protein [Actinomycetospora chiangmaiensis]